MPYFMSVFSRASIVYVEEIIMRSAPILGELITGIHGFTAINFDYINI